MAAVGSLALDLYHSNKEVPPVQQEEWT